MTQNATIAFLECVSCGQLLMSLHSDKVIREAEEHRKDYPDHELYLHTFESDTSRKL